MNELNNAQRSAATTLSKQLAIVAGPGTGKTKTLIARIDFLLKSGVSAKRILALTFTKKAAQEMHERLNNNSVKISTFHGLCFDILQPTRQFVGEAKRLQVIKNLTKPNQFKNLSARELGLVISLIKNNALAAEAGANRLVDSYNRALAQEDLLDFDDLLVEALKVLQTDAAKLQSLQAELSFILVDEFQDTNNLQYQILKLLSTPKTSLFVIGDPLQSIYGFRGASGDIFNRFLSDFPQAKQVELKHNYRSAKQITRLANAVFGGDLIAANKTQGEVLVAETLNEFSEAKWVLNQIELAIGGSNFQKSVSNGTERLQCSLKDFAIVYRNRSAAIAMRKVIDESGLPYQVVGEGSPYDQVDVQTIIQALNNAEGNLNPTTFAAEQMIRLSIKASTATKQLFATLLRFKTIQQACQYFSEISQNQYYDDKAELVTLLTIHAAKGLEFNHVFLIACEEGILPHDKADSTEEKRLFYVAITRAKQFLNLSYAQRRSSRPATLSHFVKKISIAILPRVVDDNLLSDKRRAQKFSAKRAQTMLF